MDKLRIAVIGTGGMGSFHVNSVQNIDEVQLCAVCDIRPEKAKPHGEKYSIPVYDNHKELLGKEKLDFVMIATPHPTHMRIAVDAMKKGVHVLSEKPIASNPVEGDKMVAAAEKYGRTLGLMFQQRTEAPRKKVHELIQSGILGKLYRVNMISTWYRSQAYYDSGTWRGTWAGEGGGVLLNQAPHDLDQLVWLAGKPVEVRGVVETNLHDMEVEDSASAMIRFENGATGYFHTSTVEQPVIYRIELCGDKGKIIFDGRNIKLCTLADPISDYTFATEDSFPQIPMEEQEVKVDDAPEGHAVVTREFARAILENRQPVALGAEGIAPLELAAAIIYSSYKAKTIKLPLSRRAYTNFLKEKSKTSKYDPNVVEQGSVGTVKFR
ncbi:MAG: Gfo/Idh/MocA family oxidoreductase [Planctomycetes bacterium]|nr:Gfo/Idh/MocA family oxidoreductase [Planctomycetota bacterium]